MNLFDKFANHFGSVESAMAFLSINGYPVTKSRYNEWIGGKRLPRFEVLNLILSTVTDVTLDTVSSTRSVQSSELIDAVPLDQLRKALPHRRFGKDFYQQSRLYDGQVLTAIYGYDVWKEFLSLCGNENNALYVLRRNCTTRRITQSWLHNRIDDGWQADVVNVMVKTIRRFKGSNAPFTSMDLSLVDVTPEIREKVREFAMRANPRCDFDSLPDDVISQVWKDLNGAV